MPFSDAKKAFLSSVGMSTEEISKTEADLKGLHDVLKEAKVDFKEAGTDVGVQVDANSLVIGEIRELTNAMKQLAGVVVVKNKELDEVKVALNGVIEANKKSIDAQVETALTARVASAVAAGGYRASEADGTAISKEAGEKAKEANGAGDMGFFGSMIDAQFASVLGGTGAAQ